MPRRSTDVVFAMNYPADQAYALWREGVYPASHLWGCVALETAGFHITYAGLGHQKDPSTGLGSRARFVLGSRVAQLRAVASGARVAYAADPSTFAALARLRAMGLWRRPVVAVVHPTAAGRGILGALRAYDVVITPSRLVYQTLVHEVGRSPRRTFVAPYGPDLSWPSYQPVAGDDVVSSGKTLRDEVTLLSALDGLGLPATVHTRTFAGERFDGSVRQVGSAPYARVLGDLQCAGVVAIPLTRPTGTYGLTELNDALALAKPIVMTRNPYLDVDVEGIGCGVVVEVGDVDGWRGALSRLRVPELRQELGARGRDHAEKRWNAELFGAVVREAISLVLR